MNLSALRSRSRTDALDDYRLRIRRALAGLGERAPAAWERDRHVPASAITALADAGAFRDRWRGGALEGLPHLVALSDEVFRWSSGLALSAMGHSEILIGALTRLAGHQEHRDLLADALDGRVVGCLAVTEAGGGSSLADLGTTAAATPSGWYITGGKRYVSNLGSATHVLVLARMARSADPRDLGLFLVPADAPGCTVTGFFDTGGVQACDVGELVLDVRLPATALLGQAGLGLLYVNHLLQFERMAICAQLLAAAESSIRLAASYARMREVGGARVMDRQVVRHRLAGCQAELWNLQSRLAELVGGATEHGRLPAHEVAALKVTAGTKVGDVIDACMQVFGARGNTANFPLARLWRDARVARVGGGTDEVLSDAVAALLDRPDDEADAVVRRLLDGDGPSLGPSPR